MRGWVGVLSVLFTAGLFFLAFYLENFWNVFFWPAVMMSICQAVAIFATKWATEKKFFVATDFIYYIIIGSVGGLFGYYLPALPNVLAYNAKTTYEKALVEFPRTVTALDVATKTVVTFDRTVSLMTPEQQSCMFPSLPPNLDDRSKECEGPRGILTALAMEQGRVQWLSSRKTQLESIISQGSDTRGPSFPEDWTFFLLYQIFPSLLLCGAALKVGKTTLALLT